MLLMQRRVYKLGLQNRKCKCNLPDPKRYVHQASACDSKRPGTKEIWAQATSMPSPATRRSCRLEGERDPKSRLD